VVQYLALLGYVASTKRHTDATVCVTLQPRPRDRVAELQQLPKAENGHQSRPRLNRNAAEPFVVNAQPHRLGAAMGPRPGLFGIKELPLAAGAHKDVAVGTQRMHKRRPCDLPEAEPGP
jgi:hypothetical protein